MLKSDETTPAVVNDAQRVEQLKQMDGVAWVALLNRYTADLRADIVISLRKRGLPETAADDILQETWRTVIVKIEAFVPQGEGSLYRWMRVISLNHIHNYQRSIRRQVSLDALDDEGEQHLDHFLFETWSGADGVEGLVALRQEMAALDRVLDTLKPIEKDILLRNVMYGETPEQLAERYPHLKPRSISQMLWRLKKQIRRLLPR